MGGTDDRDHPVVGVAGNQVWDDRDHVIPYRAEFGGNYGKPRRYSNHGYPR